MKEDLQKLKERLLESVHNEGVAVYFGAYPSDTVPEISWNTDLEPDPSAFVRTAKSLGAKGIYLNWVVFSEEEINEALFEEVEEDDGADSSEASFEEHNERVRAFKKYIGNTASVRAAFFLDGVFHVFEQETRWYEDFGELISGEESEDDLDDEDGRTGEWKLSTEAISWAEKLARHPSFRTAKRWSQRKYLLEKLAGSEAANLPVDAILQRSETIYEVDVRPDEEKQLIEQVRAMRQSGASLIAIAGKLELSRDRVSMLLAKTED